MKEKLTRNIGLKVLSIILAILLWIVITNVDDPIGPKTFRNVPVKILNENVIAALGQVYDVTEGETIDFTVEARRSIIDDLTESDFEVTADFAHLSDVHAVTIDILCPRYGNKVVVTDGKNQTMKISLEEISNKKFKVDVIQKGEPVEGYFVGKKTASPNQIRVSGPKSRVDKVEQVCVEVDVTGVSGSYHTVVKPKALDKDGKEIDATKLKFSEDYITVSIDLYKTKTINLQITAAGDPASGYVMTRMEYEPKTIEVAGSDENLKNIRYLSINQNISGAKDNIEKEINLEEKLQEGLTIVGEDQTAVISITIEKLVTKEIKIWPDDIVFINKPTNLNVSIKTPGPITMKVKGPESLMNDLNRFNIKPHLDMYNSSTGSHMKQIKLDLSDQMTLVNHPEVEVSVSQY